MVRRGSTGATLSRRWLLRARSAVAPGGYIAAKRDLGRDQRPNPVTIDNGTHGVRRRIGRCCRWRRRPWRWGCRFPAKAVRAARGADPRNGGFWAAGQWQDGAAAILDRPGGSGWARRVGAGRAG